MIFTFNLFILILIQASNTNSQTIDKCIKPDGVITQSSVPFQLPSKNMTCQTFLDYITMVRKESPKSYCTNANFLKKCCRTCDGYLDFNFI